MISKLIQIRFLFIISICITAGLFLIGLIHPWAVLTFQIFEAFIMLLLFFALMIGCIVKFFRDLSKVDKHIFLNLARIVLCYFFMAIPCSHSHRISFFGLRAHYSLVKDYSVIRQWAGQVNSTKDSTICMNGIDIPIALRPFHPENVEIKNVGSNRITYLSWDSGFMQVGWYLIIGPPEFQYSNEKGLSAKVQPGVFLHFQFL